MENSSPEKPVPIVFSKASRAFRQFKNPPQPHMCIQDTLKDTSEKLFINVLGWQKIANPKQVSDPIPLYGGMQVPQGSTVNSNRPALLVFAVMVNPDILKANGKNASNPTDREALVNLLCDFVEAMNPGLSLSRRPEVLQDRDLAGELKDVWLAVQIKREREKVHPDVMYTVYDIDNFPESEPNEDDRTNNQNMNKSSKKIVKSSKQILLNAGQKSEFDSGMNNTQLQHNKDTSGDTTYCTPVHGQIVSSRENHNQINDIQQKLTTEKASTSFRKEWNTVHGKTTEGWDEFSKRNISTINTGDSNKNNSKMTNGKHYDFFPVFDNNETEKTDDSTKIILEPMQNLNLHATDSNICDSSRSAVNS